MLENKTVIQSACIIHSYQFINVKKNHKFATMHYSQTAALNKTSKNSIRNPIWFCLRLLELGRKPNT